MENQQGIVQEYINAENAKKVKANAQAIDLRRKYDDITSQFNTDGWFDANGEVIQELVDRDLASLKIIDDKERDAFKQRVKDFTGQLQVYKRAWFDAEDARIEKEKEFYDIQDRIIDLKQQKEKEAFDKIVDMINDRKEKELKAAEEIHKETTGYLDERTANSVNNSKSFSSSIGDVNIVIQVSVDNVNKRLLKNWGTDILGSIKAEMDKM